MMRQVWILSLALLCGLLPALAWAQTVHVVVLGVRGKGAGPAASQGLQDALKKLRNISFETTRNYMAEADQRGVAERVESDPRAMAQVARVLEVDAVVRGQLDESGKSKAKALTVSVYNGADGKLLGEEVVDVPAGKLAPKIYADAARAIEPYLRMASHKPSSVVAPMAHDSPRPPAREETQPEDRQAEDQGLGQEAEPTSDDDDDFGNADSGPRRDFLRARGGLAFVSRTFRYRVGVDPEVPPEQQFFVLQDGTPDGISYNSSLSPGVAVDAEVYPFALQSSGVISGLGLTLAYEKVFLGTEQKKTEGDATTQSKLDTSQSALDVGLRFRYPFGTGPAAPEVAAEAGLSLMFFSLGNNEEYRGTDYRFLHLGLGGRVPFGTPLIGAEVDLRFIPMASMDDTTEELGESADVSGYGVTAGLFSEFGGGFTATLALDYTAFTGDISGEGRSAPLRDANGDPVLDANGDPVQKRRIGKSMEDAYLGFRALVGYHF